MLVSKCGDFHATIVAKCLEGCRADNLIAQTNPSDLVDYYPLTEDPAVMIVDKMEASTDAELRARVEQERQA